MWCGRHGDRDGGLITTAVSQLSQYSLISAPSDPEQRKFHTRERGREEGGREGEREGEREGGREGGRERGKEGGRGRGRGRKDDRGR